MNDSDLKLLAGVRAANIRTLDDLQTLLSARSTLESLRATLLHNCQIRGLLVSPSSSPSALLVALGWIGNAAPANPPLPPAAHGATEAPSSASPAAAPPASPPSAWAQLTDAQRQHATTAGYAKTPEAREKFAAQYLESVGKGAAAAGISPEGSNWSRLSDAQRQYATSAGFARTEEAREKFASEYLKMSGKLPTGV